MRFDVELPFDEVPLGGVLPRVSPDGSTVVVRLIKDSQARLLAKRLDTGTLVELPRSDAASPPSWAPDSTGVLFPSGGTFRRVDLSGPGTATDVRLDDVTVGPGSTYSWGASGNLLMVDPDSRVMLAPVTGGAAQPVPLTLPDGHRPGAVEFLPDGQRFLLTTTSPTAPAVYLAEIGGGAPRLVAEGIGGRIAFVAPGHLLYVSQSALMAQAIDVTGARLRGDAVRLADGVAPGSFSGSASVVAYSATPAPRNRFTWHDRRTDAAGPVGEANRYLTFDLWPDGRSIVASVGDENGRWPAGDVSVRSRPWPSTVPNRPGRPVAAAPVPVSGARAVLAR
jgi:hypothetical protein